MSKPLPKAFVKPAPGCLVRKGLGQPFLKPEGEEVELTTYWLRRINMVDVVRVGAIQVLGDDTAARRENVKVTSEKAANLESKKSKQSKGNQS